MKKEITRKISRIIRAARDMKLEMAELNLFGYHPNQEATLAEHQTVIELAGTVVMEEAAETGIVSPVPDCELA